jgi:hypothetical protein
MTLRANLDSQARGVVPLRFYFCLLLRRSHRRRGRGRGGR